MILPPRIIPAGDELLVACATNVGRLLLFPLQQLPELSRGKGNKLINVPSSKSATREEFIVDIQVLKPTDVLTVHAGKRHFSLKGADLIHYQGERGRRGNSLPRGLQNVTHLVVGE